MIANRLLGFTFPCLLVLGCSSASSPNTPSGILDGGQRDSGHPTTDASGTTDSATTPPRDGGTGPVDGGTAPGDGGTGAQQAVTDYANAFCNQINTCIPVSLALLYGDLTTCVTRVELAATSLFGLSGVTYTPVELEACAQAYAASTCEQGIESDVSLPACVVPPGTLAAGAVCGNNAQCQSGYCPGTNGCGTCTERVMAGGACQKSSQCAAGEICLNSVCAAVGALGAACSATAPCDNPYDCNGSTCVARLSSGSACTTTPQCEFGLYCETASGSCQADSTAASGQCGVSSTGLATYCIAGSCNIAASASTGTCVPYAQDNAACDEASDLYCLSPAQCVNGTCAVVNPSSCQ